MTLIPIPVGQCSLDQVPDVDDLKEYFAMNQINQLYCASNSSVYEYALQSTWDGPLYKNVLINIYPCVNTTENGNICKPQEVIQAALDNGNYAMHFSTLAVDPNNYEKPITLFGQDIYTPISASSLTYIEMNFEHLYMNTDQGFLLEDVEKSHFVSYSSSRQIMSFSSDIAVQIDMKLDKVANTYTRNYDKIQNVLANIGGIIKTIMILVNFFVTPLINLRFKLALANDTFNFKVKKKSKVEKVAELKKYSQGNPSKDVAKKKLNFDKFKLALANETFNFKVKKKSKVEKVADLKKYSQGDPSKDVELKLGKKKMNFDKSKDVNFKTEKLKMSYFEYFFQCFRGQSSKEDKLLLQKGLNQINHVMDISYIMHKLIEVDMLKMIFLDSDQINLFHQIPKPIISMSGKQKENLKLHKSLSHLYCKENFAAKGMEAFQAVSSKVRKSMVDQKLLELIPKYSKPIKITKENLDRK